MQYHRGFRSCRICWALCKNNQEQQLTQHSPESPMKQKTIDKNLCQNTIWYIKKVSYIWTALLYCYFNENSKKIRSRLKSSTLILKMQRCKDAKIPCVAALSWYTNSWKKANIWQTCLAQTCKDSRWSKCCRCWSEVLKIRLMHSTRFAACYC